MTTADRREWLLGRDRELPLRYLLVAGGVLAGGLALQYWLGSMGPRGVAWNGPGVDLVWLVAAVAVGLAAVPGYLDDGLLAGWTLGSVPFVARAFGPAVVPARAFDQPILLGLAMAALLGVMAGSVGFVFGVGGRRVRDVDRSPGMESQ